MVEVISVGAAERRLKKPIEIPRPRPLRRPVAAREQRAQAERAAGAVSVADAIPAFAAAGRVRPALPAGGEPA